MRQLITCKAPSKKIIIFVGFMVALLFCYIFLYPYINYADKMTYYLNNYPVLAPLIFIVTYAVLTFLLVPALPLNIIAGMAFGWFWGGVLSAFSGTLGAIVSFYIARNILSDVSKYNLYKKYESQYPWLFDGGWKIVAICRLCIVLPTGLMNYLFGLTKINPITYSTMTLVFLIPPSLIVSGLAHFSYRYYMGGTVIFLGINILLLLFFFFFIYMAKKLKIKLDNRRSV